MSKKVQGPKIPCDEPASQRDAASPLRRLADATKDPQDIEAADLAERLTRGGT